MGGGPSKSDQAEQRQIQQQQLTQSAEMDALAKEQYAQQQKYQAPLAGFLQSLIGGDQGAQQTAFAPIAGNIDKGFQGAKDQIYNQIPAGAARDYALAELPVQQNAQKSSALNSLILQAFPTLANLGSSSGAEAIQGFGGALSGLSGAANTGSQLMQAQAQSKAATMGFLGSLAGAGGMAIGGHK